MNLPITSPHNPRVKHLVKLRDKRQRERDGLLLVEGYEELTLALASGARPQTVWLCRDLWSTAAPTLLAQLEQQSVEIIETPRPVFEKIAYREGADGWLAVFPRPQRHLRDLALGSAPLLLVAEAIEKPGNLGAILRSADAAGVAAVIVCDPTTDVTNPNVVRSSKGTLFTLPVIEARTDEALTWLAAHHIPLLAATPHADKLYTDVDLRGPLAIAVGAEKDGLSLAFLQHAPMQARIPMLGKVNALNVSAATAVMLFEAVRQRRVAREK